MSWWSSVREALSRPLAGRPAPPAVEGSRQETRAEPVWPHLPSVQRVLAEPITPTAPLDAFADSLAAHQDPSFLAPLSHAVSAREAGGLVDGLADLAPGAPHRYRAAGELAVHRSVRKPLVQRQPAGWASFVDEVALEPYTEVPEDGAIMLAGTGDPDAPVHALSASPLDSRSPSTSSGDTSSMGQSAPSRALSVSKGQSASARALSLSKGQSALPVAQRHATSPESVDPSPRALSLSKGQSATPAETGSSEDEAPTAPLTSQTSPLVSPAAEPTGGASAEQPAVAAAGPSPAEPSPPAAAVGAPPVQRTRSPLVPPPTSRVWPVVPDRSPRRPGWPELPTRELTVARIEKPATSAQIVVSPRPVLGAGEGHGEPSDPDVAGPRASSVTTDEPSTPARDSEPDEAPLSGFAAAIATLQRDGGESAGGPSSLGFPRAKPASAREISRADAGFAREDSLPESLPESVPESVPESPAVPLSVSQPVSQPVQRDVTVPPGFADAREVRADDSRLVTARREPGSRPLEAMRPAVQPSGSAAPTDSGPAPTTTGLLGTRTPHLQLEPMVRATSAGEITVPVVQRVRFPAALTTSAAPSARPTDTQLARDPDRAALPEGVASSTGLPVTVARSVTATAGSPVPNAEETADPTQAIGSFGDTSPEAVEVLQLPTFPDPVREATPLGPSLPQASPAEPEPAIAQRSRTTLPALPIVQRRPAHESPPARLTVARPPTSSAGVSFASMFAAVPDGGQESGFTSVELESGSSPDPVIQRQEGGADSAAETTTPPESAPAPTAAAAPAAATAGAAPAGTDVDELARRLFEPLSARLRAELWLDRERAGLVTDVRP